MNVLLEPNSKLMEFMQDTYNLLIDVIGKYGVPHGEQLLHEPKLSIIYELTQWLLDTLTLDQDTL